MPFQTIFKLFIVILILLTSFLFFLVVYYDYNQWLDVALELLNLQKHLEKVKVVFTIKSFNYLKYFFAFLIILELIIIYFYKKIINILMIYSLDFWKTFKNIINQPLLDFKFYGIIIIPIASVIYFGIATPVSYDEAWTYLNFTKNGFLISLTHYPAPNNHVFHSLITNFFNIFLSSFSKLVLRLPVVITYIIALYVSFYSIKKHYNYILALFVTALFSMLSMSIYYGYSSRGYGLVVLFFIISFHLVNNIHLNNQKRDWVWFSFFSILGFFTMPSYLYVFVILNIIILLQFSKEKLYNQILFGIATVVFTLLLYLPIIVINGFSVLSNNRYVAPTSREFVVRCLPDFFKKTISDIFGFHFLAPFLIIAITGILFLIQKNNKNTFNYIALFFLPITLLIIHAVLPFSRTFNYFGFVIMLMFGMAINQNLNKIKKNLLVLILLIFQTILFFNYKFNIPLIDSDAQKMSNLIIKYEKKCYIYSGLFETYLIYYIKTNQVKNLEIVHKPFINVNTDTINRDAYIVTENENDQTVNNKVVFDSEFYRIYKNKSK